MALSTQSVKEIDEKISAILDVPNYLYRPELVRYLDMLKAERCKRFRSKFFSVLTVLLNILYIFMIVVGQGGPTFDEAIGKLW